MAKIYEIGEDGCIFGKLFNTAYDWRPDGRVYADGLDCDDLMLRKKTKKVWRPTFEFVEVFNSKEECDEYYSFNKYYKEAIEVEI